MFGRNRITCFAVLVTLLIALPLYAQDAAETGVALTGEVVLPVKRQLPAASDSLGGDRDIQFEGFARPQQPRAE